MNTTDKNQTGFVTKVVVVLVAVLITFSFVMPDVEDLRSFDKPFRNLDKPVNKIYLLSLLNNPEGLYMASEIWEEQSKYENAIREMRLAIGLLEMHKADDKVIQRYRERLQKLRAKN